MSVELPRTEIHATSGRAYHPLLLVLAAFAGGMVIDRYWPVTPEYWFLGSLFALVIWGLAWLAARHVTASCVLLCAWLAIGGAWHHDYWNLYRDDEIGLMVREEIRPLAIEGIAYNSPRWVPAPPLTSLRAIPKGDETEVVLRVTAVRDGQSWRPASGWAALDVDGHLLGIQAGDRLRVMALASRPMKPLNPAEFDFANYERSRRTWCRLRGLFPDSVTVVERGSGWSSRLWLSRVRERGNAVLRQHIPAQRATLAAAILIGAREQLDPDRNEGFLVTGTIHVLSISGLHVGILAWGFWTILRTGLLPRRGALIGAMLLTVGYAFLTDLQPPVLRATVLVVAMCVARLIGRQALGFNTLAIAGLIVLAYQPASLFLAGPQLSFLAVAVMILGRAWINPPATTDPLDRLIARTRPRPVRMWRAFQRETWRIWLTGALIWLISLPLVWQSYNLISVVALVVNTVIWIPITLAMYFGFAALVLGLVAPPLGAACGWVCNLNLQFMEGCVETTRHWPGSYTWLPAPPWWWVATFYGGLLVMAVVPAFRLRPWWWAALGAAWFAIGLGLNGPISRWLDSRDDDKLRCTFVAVGHGIGCLVELPDGQMMLYDSGKLGSPLGAVRPVSAVLWSRGITHLDAVVISHADSDHFNAIPELLDRFSVGVIYVSPIMFERPQPAVEELREAIERSGVPLRAISAGDRLSNSGGFELGVLHPPRKGVLGSDNANSILLLCEYAGRRILLTGDLESPGLEDVLAEEPLDCDIVLAPHHGSLRSNPEGFAGWSTAEYVVISGARNVEDIPDIEAVKNAYRRRGAKVFHTAEDGCIWFEVSKEGITATTFRPTTGDREP